MLNFTIIILATSQRIAGILLPINEHEFQATLLCNYTLWSSASVMCPNHYLGTNESERKVTVFLLLLLPISRERSNDYILGEPSNLLCFFLPEKSRHHCKNITISNLDHLNCTDNRIKVSVFPRSLPIPSSVQMTSNDRNRCMEHVAVYSIRQSTIVWVWKNIWLRSGAGWGQEIDRHDTRCLTQFESLQLVFVSALNRTRQSNCGDLSV